GAANSCANGHSTPQPHRAPTAEANTEPPADSDAAAHACPFTSRRGKRTRLEVEGTRTKLGRIAGDARRCCDRENRRGRFRWDVIQREDRQQSDVAGGGPNR